MKLWQNQKGTTLIEVIAAVTLLTVALIPIMGGIANTNFTMLSAGRKTQAVYLAQQEIEKLKAEEFNNLADSEFTAMEEPNQVYKKKVEITDIESGLIQVEVIIKWGERPNQKVGLITQLAGGQS